MQQNLLFKILMVGDISTGKTSLIKKYVHNIFSQHYKSTIGVDFSLKVIDWDVDTRIRLQIWDIAGQERFGNMTRVYYKEAVGAFVVFDVTRSSTFESVKKWKKDIDDKILINDSSPLPVFLIGNKADLASKDELRSTKEMDEYCKENGFVGWSHASAKEGYGIESSVNILISNILKILEAPTAPLTAVNNTINLEEPPQQSNCCA